MGFALEPISTGARLRVWIAYTLPKTGARRIIGRLMAPGYARWCVDQMARDAADFFATSGPGAGVVAAVQPRRV